MTQRWNDLLFAHWPLPAVELAERLPEGLQIDTFQGSAWLSISPFWTDRIKKRGLPPLPGLSGFPALSLSTYVREQRTGTTGIYFFSLDMESLLAVGAGRLLLSLPCYWANMWLEEQSERQFSFASHRHLSGKKANFQAHYRGLGPTRKLVEGRAGTLEHFLLERSCLYTCNRSGQTLRSYLHQVTWPLEEAEAEIEQNGLGASIGLTLSPQPAVLHYARRMAVYIWPPELVRPKMAAQPVHVAVSPLG